MYCICPTIISNPHRAELNKNFMYANVYSEVMTLLQGQILQLFWLGLQINGKLRLIYSNQKTCWKNACINVETQYMFSLSNPVEPEEIICR